MQLYIFVNDIRVLCPVGHIVTNCSTNVKCCMFKYTVLQCIVCLSGLTVPLHEDIIN